MEPDRWRARRRRRSAGGLGRGAHATRAPPTQERERRTHRGIVCQRLADSAMRRSAELAGDRARRLDAREAIAAIARLATVELRCGRSWIPRAGSPRRALAFRGLRRGFGCLRVLRRGLAARCGAARCCWSPGPTAPASRLCCAAWPACCGPRRATSSCAEGARARSGGPPAPRRLPGARPRVLRRAHGRARTSRFYCRLRRLPRGARRGAAAPRRRAGRPPRWRALLGDAAAPALGLGAPRAAGGAAPRRAVPEPRPRRRGAGARAARRAPRAGPAVVASPVPLELPGSRAPGPSPPGRAPDRRPRARPARPPLRARCWRSSPRTGAPSCAAATPSRRSSSSRSRAWWSWAWRSGPLGTASGRAHERRCRCCSGCSCCSPPPPACRAASRTRRRPTPRPRCASPPRRPPSTAASCSTRSACWPRSKRCWRPLYLAVMQLPVARPGAARRGARRRRLRARRRLDAGGGDRRPGPRPRPAVRGARLPGAGAAPAPRRRAHPRRGRPATPPARALRQLLLYDATVTVAG